MTYYLLIPHVFTFVVKVFVQSPPARCSCCWKMRALVTAGRWLARGEGLCIKWTATCKAELPCQGAFLSALLKAMFCRYVSGEKRFLLLKIPA